MRRFCFTTLVLLFAMLLQQVATPHFVSMIESHHHHEDGTYHDDESIESDQHMAAEHSTVLPAITSTFTYGPLTPERHAADILYRINIPDSIAGRVFRPPRPQS